jgi:20S proteasome subunit beta 5
MALDFLKTPKCAALKSLEDDHFDAGSEFSPAMSKFMLPHVANPAQYCEDNLCPRYKDHGQQIKFAKGTTTLGFIFQGGVLISVDSRSTQGPYVASGSVQKVIEINPYLLGTMAGGAADCSFWERNLGMQCRLYELENKKRISVRAASKSLHNTLYSYKGYGLSCGTMIAGWDEGKDEGELYYVDSDGTRLQAYKEMPRFSVGSGSTYAYGVLDSNYRWDMTDEEAIELGRMAIYHATHRDAYSGGYNNVYLVKQEGWTQIHHTDVKDLHELYGQGGSQRPVKRDATSE